MGGQNECNTEKRRKQKKKYLQFSVKGPQIRKVSSC